MRGGRSGWRWIADVLRAIASDRPTMVLLFAALVVLIVVLIALSR